MNTDSQEVIFDNELITDNVTELNKYLASDEELILCVNIRSLNANFNKLLVFLNSLVTKPCIIVCTETWDLQHHEFFNIPKYRMYYNESKINKSDGVVLYISEDITENTEIIQINRHNEHEKYT